MALNSKKVDNWSKFINDMNVNRDDVISYFVASCSDGTLKNLQMSIKDDLDVYAAQVIESFIEYNINEFTVLFSKSNFHLKSRIYLCLHTNDSIWKKSCSPSFEVLVIKENTYEKKVDIKHKVNIEHIDIKLGKGEKLHFSFSFDVSYEEKDCNLRKIQEQYKHESEISVCFEDIKDFSKIDGRAIGVCRKFDTLIKLYPSEPDRSFRRPWVISAVRNWYTLLYNLNDRRQFFAEEGSKFLSGFFQRKQLTNESINECHLCIKKGVASKYILSIIESCVMHHIVELDDLSSKDSFYRKGRSYLDLDDGDSIWNKGRFHCGILWEASINDDLKIKYSFDINHIVIDPEEGNSERLIFNFYLDVHLKIWGNKNLNHRGNISVQVIVDFSLIKDFSDRAGKVVKHNVCEDIVTNKKIWGEGYIENYGLKINMSAVEKPRVEKNWDIFMTSMKCNRSDFIMQCMESMNNRNFLERIQDDIPEAISLYSLKIVQSFVQYNINHLGSLFSKPELDKNAKQYLYLKGNHSIWDIISSDFCFQNAEEVKLLVSITDITTEISASKNEILDYKLNFRFESDSDSVGYNTSTIWPIHCNKISDIQRANEKNNKVVKLQVGEYQGDLGLRITAVDPWLQGEDEYIAY